MAVTYTQTDRPLRVTSPLGKDVLLLTGFSGKEEISKLFHFQLDLMAANTQEVAFDKILGQNVLVEMEMVSGSGKMRCFHGLVSRFSQGGRNDNFVQYRAEVVPQFWLLTKRTQSRIFQHIKVPDILKEVLKGLKVDYKLHGTYEARDYCVQYRESDFAFASRLMEEEGIYYYFEHASDGHTMIVADTPQDHLDIPGSSTIEYEEVSGGNRPEPRIVEWEKFQELRSGKTTLWDHCFELPHKHLEADRKILDSAKLGTVTHKLSVTGVDKLELYDYPGGYAQRFDGVAPGGGDRGGDIQKIFQDNARTVAIRMQEEAAPALMIQGSSLSPALTAGHKFTLKNHFDADGQYVLLQVHHTAAMGSFRSGNDDDFSYTNHFHCMPIAVPFRPPRTTHKPTVAGSQTAVVVGPPGEEIFTDKYGRIKVQFFWDRQGKNNADSSCWIRVGTPWAGKQWGIIHIPRIGQEVIVDFLEGDPDQPIVVGSVYNAEQMPPYALPAHKTQSGIQSRSSLGGSAANFNQIRFEDKKGSEQVHIHAEKNQDIEVENDETHWVGHDRKKTIDNNETTHVKNNRTETVDVNETITVHGARTETVDGNETITIHSNRTETVDANESITVGASRTRHVAAAEVVTVGGAQAITVGGARAVTVGGAQAISVGAAQVITVGGSETETYGASHTQSVGGGQNVSVAGAGGYKIGGARSTTVGGGDSLKVGAALTIDAADSITLKTGGASITMKSDGTITIKGTDITIDGSGKILAKSGGKFTVKGSDIDMN